MKTTLTKAMKQIEILRNIAILILIGAMVFILSCGRETDETKAAKEQAPLVSGPFYRFIPGEDGMLEKAEKLEFPPGMDAVSVLKALGDDLARTYFESNPAGEKTGIGFEILGLSAIESAGRIYQVAVINMVDRKEEGLRHFFQGSSGGQATFHIMAATFMQPQTRPPLADGLIMQYNGSEFGELDHINFQGIVVPGVVSSAVKTALYKSFGKP
jgi:hypothetical protein